jgi:bifunctional non-homologous end joining protein LigD
VFGLLPHIAPMPLVVAPGPFDSPDWIFEVKYDGFRAIVYAHAGKVALVSRKGNDYRWFGPLCHEMAQALPPDTILDGEIVSVDRAGKPVFNDLLRRRAEPQFFAFDCLWLEGRDLRELPLIERKRILKRIVPKAPSRLHLVSHAERNGTGLFEAVCGMDLEGLVAKWRHGPYLQDGRTSWAKIKNPNYSQAEGRRELFAKGFSKSS